MVPAGPAMVGAARYRMANTSTNVPMISEMTLSMGLRMAGPVAKTASVASGSSVAAKWGR